MFKNIPHAILQKNTCQNSDNQCNHLNPYNNLELYGNNKLTDKEKETNLKRYNNSCENRGGELSMCCDKYDIKLEGVLDKMKFKRPKGKQIIINLENWSLLIFV